MPAGVPSAMMTSPAAKVRSGRCAWHASRMVGMTRAGRICRARGESNARAGPRLPPSWARDCSFVMHGDREEAVPTPESDRRGWHVDCFGRPACTPPSPAAVASPIQRYLERLHARHAELATGEVATYIPELGKADPDWFGICLATTDGQRLRGRRLAPDASRSSRSRSRSPTAWRSRTAGYEAVLAKVGVEPTGDAFNSISLASRDRLPAEPDDQRRRDRDDVARRRTLGRGPARAPARRLLALRRPPARDRRGRLPLGEGDRPPQPRDRPHAAELRRPDRRSRRRARPLLPAVLDPGRLPRPGADGGDARERRRASR